MAKKNIDIIKAQKLVKALYIAKDRLVKDRDKLRGLFDELATLLEDSDEGIGEITDGLRSIESGLDTISQDI